MTLIKSLTLLLLCILVLNKTLNHNQQSSSAFVCCPDTYVWDHATLSCICPADKPMINSIGQCEACPKNAHWHPARGECIVCPSTAIYEPVSGNCSCPATLPYQDANKNCVKCDSPNFWNCKTLSCNKCPNNLQFNHTLKMCVCPK